MKSFLTFLQNIVPSSSKASQSRTEDESVTFLAHVGSLSPTIVLHSKEMK